MAMMGDETVFVDANVLIYSKQQQSPFNETATRLNETATRRLEDLEQQGVVLWVSRQILREYLAAMSRQEKLTKKVATPVLIEDVRGFTERFRVADEGADVTARLLWLLERVEAGGKQVHDVPTLQRRCSKAAWSTFSRTTCRTSSASRITSPCCRSWRRRKGAARRRRGRFSVRRKTPPRCAVAHAYCADPHTCVS